MTTDAVVYESLVTAPRSIIGPNIMLFVNEPFFYAYRCIISVVDMVLGREAGKSLEDCGKCRLNKETLRNSGVII